MKCCFCGQLLQNSAGTHILWLQSPSLVRLLVHLLWIVIIMGLVLLIIRVFALAILLSDTGQGSIAHDAKKAEPARNAHRMNLAKKVPSLVATELASMVIVHVILIQ